MLDDHFDLMSPKLMNLWTLKDTLIIYHTTLYIAIGVFQEKILDIHYRAVSYNKEGRVQLSK